MCAVRRRVACAIEILGRRCAGGEAVSGTHPKRSFPPYKGITEALISPCEVRRQATAMQGGWRRDVSDMLRHVGGLPGRRSRSSMAPTCSRWSIRRRSSRWCSILLVNGAPDSVEEHGRCAGGREADRRRGCRDLLRQAGCGMTAEVLEHLFEPFFTRRRWARAPASACRSCIGSSPTTVAGSRPRVTARAGLDVPGHVAARRRRHGRTAGCGCRPAPHPRRWIIAPKQPRPMRILFADDETSIQELMRIELPALANEATVCPDGRTAAGGPGEDGLRLRDRRSRHARQLGGLDVIGPRPRHLARAPRP